jgi:hypothetical protein
MHFRVSVSFVTLFTGPEPDRQVNLLERKHPYFLPCPFILNKEEAVARYLVICVSSRFVVPVRCFLMLRNIHAS